MPDIAMCPGKYVASLGSEQKDCPYAKACYRFTAKPSMMQSFMELGPYVPKSSKGCSYFYHDLSLRSKELAEVAFARYMNILTMPSISRKEYLEARRLILVAFKSKTNPSSR